MKHIETFEDLKKLPNGTKVMVFSRGRYDTIIVIGTIPNSMSLVVVNDDNWSKALVISDTYFGSKDRIFILHSSYDTVEAGELMITQLAEYVGKETNDIREVYLK